MLRLRSCARAWLAAVPFILINLIVVGRAPFGVEAARSPLAIYVSPTGSDLGDGSPGAPLRTIVAASRRARPGAIVRFEPGVYEGGFTTNVSGTAEAPIAYVSAIKWGAKIVPGRHTRADTAWENQGAYVVINGFEIDGSPPAGGEGSPWRVGIYSTGSHSVIRDNHVHDIAISTPCTDLGGAGVEGDAYYGGSNIDLRDNVVHDIGSAGCRYVHGAYQTATGSVTGNVVYRVSGWGIHLWHDAHDITITRNIVFNNTNGGILVGGGAFVNTKGPADHVTVLNNIVFGNSQFGIAESGYTGTHNRFTCNLSYDNGRNWRLRTNKVQPCETVTPVCNPVPDKKCPDWLAPTGGGRIR
jgi:hypothetical protein